MDALICRRKAADSQGEGYVNGGERRRGSTEIRGPGGPQTPFPTSRADSGCPPKGHSSADRGHLVGTEERVCRTRAHWGSCERRTGESRWQGKAEEENRVTEGGVFSVQKSGWSDVTEGGTEASEEGVLAETASWAPHASVCL